MRVYAEQSTFIICADKQNPIHNRYCDGHTNRRKKASDDYLSGLGMALNVLSLSRIPCCYYIDTEMITLEDEEEQQTANSRIAHGCDGFVRFTVAPMIL